MPPHATCDWSEQRALVLAKFESIQGDLDSHKTSLTCLTRKVADLRVDTASLPEIRKDVDEIRSLVSDIKAELSGLKGRNAMASGLIAAFVAGLGAILTYMGS